MHIIETIRYIILPGLAAWGACDLFAIARRTVRTLSGKLRELTRCDHADDYEHLRSCLNRYADDLYTRVAKLEDKTEDKAVSR